MDENNPEYIKNKKRQNIIFYLNISTFVFFIIMWTAGIFRVLFGFDPHWAGDNFYFNVVYLFPATILSVLISYYTGAWVLINRKIITNKRKAIVTLILSFLLISYVTYYFFMLLRMLH